MQTVSSQTKLCPQCYKDKPLALFSKRSGGFARTCAYCRKRYASWSTKTLEEKLAGVPPRVDASPTGRVLWVPRSFNQKLGGIPASWSERGTCPPSCGRHNVAGDLQGDGQRLHIDRLMELVRANEGRRGFTFTHKIGPIGNLQFSIANEEGFTINLSADTLEIADEYASLGVAPVSVLLPHDAPIRLKTPAGRRVTVCPAETEGLTCRECELCTIPDRKTIIGFRAHGNYRKHVTELVQLRRKTAS